MAEGEGGLGTWKDVCVKSASNRYQDNCKPTLLGAVATLVAPYGGSANNILIHISRNAIGVD